MYILNIRKLDNINLIYLINFTQAHTQERTHIYARIHNSVLCTHSFTFMYVMLYLSTLLFTVVVIFRNVPLRAEHLGVLTHRSQIFL